MNTYKATCVIVSLLIIGCGTGPQPDPGFHTSGSREADQRASQRMAQAEQLAGSGEGGGEKGVKKAKVKKPDENASGASPQPQSL